MAKKDVEQLGSMDSLEELCLNENKEKKKKN